MSFSSRIIKNIIRKYWRSILIFVILSTVVILASVSYSMAAAADNNLKEVRKKVGNSVYLTPSDNAYRNDDLRPITIDSINKLNNSEYLKDVSYNITVPPIQTLLPSLKDVVLWESTNGQDGNNGKPLNYSNTQFFSCSNAQFAQQSIEKWGYKIVDGHFYTQNEIDNQNNVVVINEELAIDNNLSVGDTIKFKFHTPNNYDKVKEFELSIVGIYTAPEKDDPNSFTKMFSPASVMEKMLKDSGYDKGNNLSDVTFLLNDPMYSEKFIEEAYKVFDKEYFTLDANDFLYNILAEPFAKLKSFSSISCNIVIGAGALIMLVVLFIITKERKNEIGILRALGITKLKIFTQLLCEVILISILSISIGNIVAPVITDNVTSHMLQQQVNSWQESGENTYFGIDYSDDLEVADSDVNNISGKDMLSIACITIIISIIGSLASAYIITKSEPMKILKKL